MTLPPEEPQNMPENTREQQIAQIKKQIGVFNVLQIVMPALMIVAALAIPRFLHHADPDAKRLMQTVLYLFAALDFFLIRFKLLPIARKRLAELEGRL